MQWEDGRPRMYGTAVGHVSEYHNGRSNKIRVTKTRCTNTRTKRYIKTTPIYKEDYFKNAMSKDI